MPSEYRHWYSGVISHRWIGAAAQHTSPVELGTIANTYIRFKSFNRAISMFRASASRHHPSSPKLRTKTFGVCCRCERMPTVLFIFICIDNGKIGIVIIWALKCVLFEKNVANGFAVASNRLEVLPWHELECCRLPRQRATSLTPPHSTHNSQFNFE